MRHLPKTRNKLITTREGSGTGKWKWKNGKTSFKREEVVAIPSKKSNEG